MKVEGKKNGEKEGKWEKEAILYPLHSEIEKNKSTGHVSSVNLVVSKSLLHNTKHPNASTNCNMAVKSVIMNLQSVLWYSTNVSYRQVVIHNLKAQCNLTSWSFWRIKCLFSVYTVSLDWNRTTPCHLKGNGCSILRLTGLWPSKTRPSEHLVMAINQPLKRTDHDCWWVTNSRGDTGASGPSK